VEADDQDRPRSFIADDTLPFVMSRIPASKHPVFSDHLIFSRTCPISDCQMKGK
jgi:hypothetical protein